MTLDPIRQPAFMTYSAISSGQAVLVDVFEGVH